MADFIDLFLNLTRDMGYWGIFLLMTVESSFIPFPSEIVIPPAAYLAFKGEMNIYFVILFGTLGSIVGALVNYYLAKFLGRPVVYGLVKRPWAKYLLLSEDKLNKAEEYFRKNGALSTFIGRLLPAIRQLISLPAGFVKMKMVPFLFYTFLGSALWVSVLTSMGYFLGANQELIVEYSKLIGYGILGVVIFVVIVWLFVSRTKKS